MPQGCVSVQREITAWTIPPRAQGRPTKSPEERHIPIKEVVHEDSEQV